MKDINKLKDYRKKYKRYYGIDFSKDYVVHHIDFDRSNNDISNLLLMPRKLHAQYHFCLTSMGCETDQTGPKFMVDGRIRSTMHGDWYLSVLERFGDIMMECAKWYDYKNYLDGYMPNVHGITLD